MESQLHHPTTTHGLHRHEEDHHNAGLHSVMEGEGEVDHSHQGDKRSVMKKVKDKAKKIKNTITKHGGHGHEHDVDDDEDDETVVDPDVHGAAPTDFISGTALPKQTGPNLGKNQSSTPPVVDRQTRSSVRNEVVYDDDVNVARVGVAMASDPHHHQGPNIRNEVFPSIRDDDVMKNSAPLMEDDPYIPNIEEEYSSGVGDKGVFKFKNSPDPYIPTVGEDEYSGVGDVGVFKTFPDPYIPTNIGKEDYSGVGDVGVLNNKSSSPSPTLDDPYNPNKRSDVADAPMLTDLLEPLPASRGPTESEQRRTNVAEPVVKIAPMEDLEKDPHAPGATQPPNYQTKVVDTTGQGGREADVTPLIERLCNLSVGDNKSESMPNTINPDSDQSMPRATVAGKISGVTSAIADKATSAKNAVATSLGYGSSQTQEGQEPSRNTAMGSLSEYGHTVAEKLAPVYGKAAGAGSALMSKVQGRGGDGAVKEGDQRGMSVQGYLAEKFTPGEEDKELSKVITDAIHRKKKEGGEVVVEEEEPRVVKEKVRIEAVCSDEKTAAGVVDRVKGAIGSWLGSKQQGYGVDADAGAGAGAGAVAPVEGLDKEQVSKLHESSSNY